MKGNTYVLDAGAIIAYIRQETGWDRVPEAMSQPDGTVYAHAANLAEVFYDVRRSDGDAVAQQVIVDLWHAGVVLREDLDTAFWQDAARLKADYRRVSLADCFGLALARRVDGTFLTTDRHEIEPLAKAGVCDVSFIR